MSTFRYILQRPNNATLSKNRLTNDVIKIEQKLGACERSTIQ